MKLNLPDMETDRRNAKLSFRERLALRFLWLMFCIVYPAKWSNQLSTLYHELVEEGAGE